MQVFVYGTLKNGYGNNRLLRTSRFVEEKEIKGFKLFNAGFPVATPSEDESILGEVWDIGDDQEVLHNLDRLEGEGRMYHRTQVDEDLSMYVGDESFWDGFQHLQECPKDDKGRYIWGR